MSIVRKAGPIVNDLAGVIAQQQRELVVGARSREALDQARALIRQGAPTEEVLAALEEGVLRLERVGYKPPSTGDEMALARAVGVVAH